MGNQLKIDSSEAVALATELAQLMGGTLDEAVLVALRHSIAVEQKRHARLAAINEAIAAIQATLDLSQPPPGHDWLYDDKTGLPV